MNLTKKQEALIQRQVERSRVTHFRIGRSSVLAGYTADKKTREEFLSAAMLSPDVPIRLRVTCADMLARMAGDYSEERIERNLKRAERDVFRTKGRSKTKRQDS